MCTSSSVSLLPFLPGLRSGSFISARRDAPRCERRNPQANGRGHLILLADTATKRLCRERAKGFRMILYDACRAMFGMTDLLRRANGPSFEDFGFCPEFSLAPAGFLTPRHFQAPTSRTSAL